MDKILRALLAKKQERLAAAGKINELAATESRDLSAEEQAQFEALTAEVEQLNGKIAAQQRMIEAARTAPGVAIPAGAISVEENIERDPARGFSHLGQFANAVRQAVLRPQAADARLAGLSAAAASTYANESVGADGGYLVPPEYARDILSVMEGQENLFNRVRQIPLTGNTFSAPVNETTAHGTSGIQWYWDSEAATMTQTKPVYQNREIKLGRVTALCPVTEEAREDAQALGTWIQMEAGEKLAFKLSDGVLNGTGAGQPLGVMKAPCLVTVSKETSQVADSLLTENVLKMFSRMPAGNRSRAVWVMNQDLEPLLPSLVISAKNVAGTENITGTPAYLPPGGLTGQQYGTLLGRPIVFHEAAQAVGDLGDIVFGDFSQYIAVVKGGVKADQSMHLWFDQNLRAFRFVFRMNGMPWLSAPIGRKNGSKTLSHFITLEAR